MINKYLVLLIMVFLTGCAGEQNKPIDDLIEYNEELEKIEVADEVELDSNLGEIIDIETLGGDKDFSRLKDIEVDEDISVLPATLAYAQVARMMYDVESYVGKTVKMKGIYFYEVLEAHDIERNQIMVLDETSCCQGFFEMILEDGVDYPENGEWIMVIGEYQARSNGKYSYPVLVVSDYIF